MKKLFEPVNLGGVSAKNRIVRSATMEGMAVDGGDIDASLVAVYAALAQGGVGTIITGMVGIDDTARVGPIMVKTYGEKFVEGLSQIVRSAAQYDCNIVVQIAHGGMKASPDGGELPLTPSVVRWEDRDTREMSIQQIRQVVASFAEAALRCKQAGAAGVQIHGAHGYLLSEFLSPVLNRRTDEYGGTIENRARIVLEVYDAIRQKVGKEFPIWIKINSEDFVENGLTFEDCVCVCQQLDRRGIDCIEVSGGVSVSRESAPTRLAKNREEQGPFSQYGLDMAEAVDAAVISVGGYRTVSMMEEWLNRGKLQAVSICRPLICEPNLPNQWQQDAAYKARCISCNKCFDFSTGFGCKVFGAQPASAR